MADSKKYKVKRIPKRAIYDLAEIYPILDQNFITHVGFVHQGYPVVIPTMYGRHEDSIYIHGASVSRLITDLEKDIAISASIAKVNGIVLARSLFNHSMNYESVVIFGKGTLVPDDKKEWALKIISDQVLPGRWEKARLPSPKELKATKVIRIEIEDVSAKRREGPPEDEKADYELDVWAGVLPLSHEFGEPTPDPLLDKKIPICSSIVRYSNK